MRPTRSLRRTDIVAGCAIALLGAVVIVAASQIRGDVEERLPPRTLPYAVGITTLAGGIALAVRSWRYRGEDAEVQWPGGDGWVRIAVILLLLALFTALIGPLGMPVATALYVAAAIWYLDRSRLLAALFIGSVSGVVVYYLFIRLLGLSFPLGLLER